MHITRDTDFGDLPDDVIQAGVEYFFIQKLIANKK